MPPGLEFKGGVNRTVILRTTLLLIGTIFKCCFTPDLKSLLDNTHEKKTAPLGSFQSSAMFIWFQSIKAAMSNRKLEKMTSHAARI